jgi:hypothetical protein
MPRSFQDVLKAMQNLTKGLPSAYGLVRRLGARAVVRTWDPGTPFDPEGEFSVAGKVRVSNPVFLFLLPKGASTPKNDALVWTRPASYKDEEIRVLFIHPAPCHEDWLALKAVYEYGLLELQEMVWEVSRRIVERRSLSGASLEFHIGLLVDNFHARHEHMIGRLMDRRLRGKIASRIKSLKETVPEYEREEDDLKLVLVDDINKWLLEVWPRAANRQERCARYDLMTYAARGLLCRSDDASSVN